MPLLDVQPGERRKVLALWAVGVAYAAAIGVGENVAQALFADRVGAPALARLFLVKGVFDVAAAALYLPLTRGRSPRRVLEVALAIYAATMLLGRLTACSRAPASSYALYLGHECAGTILTIHWGVYCLDLFDAGAARRLFPLIFTAARVGGIAGGLALTHLAHPLGAENLLAVSAGLAGIGIVLAWRLRGGHEQPDAAVVEEAAGPALLATWRTAWASPLVRAIAVSTAAMVFLRYGLRLLSLDAFDTHFGDADQMAKFLGTYSSWANVAAIALGLLVTPRLIRWLGVGFVNTTYAVATAGAYGLLAVFPSLGAAVTARFVDSELKDALKTPLSALFYGAEAPRRRAEARAFVFGAVIPAATVTTSVIFEIATGTHSARALVYAGLAVAAAFIAASAWQNRAYARRLKS